MTHNNETLRPCNFLLITADDGSGGMLHCAACGPLLFQLVGRPHLWSTRSPRELANGQRGAVMPVERALLLAAGHLMGTRSTVVQSVFDAAVTLAGLGNFLGGVNLLFERCSVSEF